MNRQERGILGVQGGDGAAVDVMWMMVHRLTSVLLHSTDAY